MFTWRQLAESITAAIKFGDYQPGQLVEVIVDGEKRTIDCIEYKSGIAFLTVEEKENA